METSSLPHFLKGAAPFLLFETMIETRMFNPLYGCQYARILQRYPPTMGPMQKPWSFTQAKRSIQAKALAMSTAARLQAATVKP